MLKTVNSFDAYTEHILLGDSKTALYHLCGMEVRLLPFFANR